jgi:probable phosphoglycerate mutase
MENWADMPSVAGTGAKEGIARIQAASDEFFARQGYVREGVKYRVEKPNNDRIALFAHGGFGVAFLSVLLGIPPQFVLSSFEMPHCGISIFHFANNADGWTQPRCLSYSDTSFQYEDRLPMLYNNKIRI